jgi:hypothetical protein
MAKTRQDLIPYPDELDNWVAFATHVVDEPDQPFRDYHVVGWAQAIWYPSGLPWWGCSIYVNDRAKAHGLALIMAANPGLVSDMCIDCHWPYYRLFFPRWETLKPPPAPPRYLTWPDDHVAIVPACMGWQFTWSWDPDPPYPYD